VYPIKHLGKIREKLSNRGYYISNLGIIKEDDITDYILGDIRHTPPIKRLLIRKEEVVISPQNEDIRLCRLIRILKEEKIHFRKAKF
jgi:hypothetical protein